MVGMGMFGPMAETAPLPAPDVARLREVLHDRTQPLAQSQAALLLVQARTAEANRILRRALQETETPDVFLAITSALRLCEDNRFNPELLTAIQSDRAALHQNAADTLVLLADSKTLHRLETLVRDAKTQLGIRQTILLALGHSGRKEAAAILIGQLSGPESIRQTTVEALTELTGHSYGDRVARWQAWWAAHGTVSNERWLQERLYYQTSRGRRLAGELDQARAQVVHLEQQLYSRLPPADRLNHVRGLVDAEDAGLRALAVGWTLELWPTCDTVGRHTLADVLLRLSHDSTVEVQRAAVLALGRVSEPSAFQRLCELLQLGSPSVRAAAARALTQQAANSADNGGPSRATQRQVVPVLQKALEDPSSEVVVEAAEDLGSLGVPEAGPVLTSLLHHSSEPVRQTAARALERVADTTVLDGLLAAFSDSVVAVRFSLVGAVGHAVGDGRELADNQRSRVLDHLQDLLLRDPDAGVRSRAATVLGQCGSPDLLPLLWRRVHAAEDSRVQEKAWAAMVAILGRSNKLALLQTWDSQLAAAGQDDRRVQLLSAVVDLWKTRETSAALVTPATEMLIQADLDEQKWASALPLIHTLLKRPGTTPDSERRLRWLLLASQQALHAGNTTECLHAVQEAQPHLAGNATLAREFAALEKRARGGLK